MLQPNNFEARQKLARLDNPFADLEAFVQDGENQGPGTPSEWEAEPGIYTETPAAVVVQGEPSFYLEPAKSQQIELPQKEAVAEIPKPSQPKKQQVARQKKSGRWLEIFLVVMAVVCLLGVVMIVIGQNPSLLKTRPEPTPESSYDVILRNRDTANAEDLDGYMDTIHPAASGRFLTRTAMQDLFAKYDLRYDVYNLKILEQKETEARVAFTLITRKIRGPAFSNNRVDGVMILRLEKGQWKIYNQEINNVTYID
jgi:hypothetical protein